MERFIELKMALKKNLEQKFVSNYLEEEFPSSYYKMLEQEGEKITLLKRVKNFFFSYPIDGFIDKMMINVFRVCVLGSRRKALIRVKTNSSGFKIVKYFLKTWTFRKELDKNLFGILTVSYSSYRDIMGFYDTIRDEDLASECGALRSISRYVEKSMLELYAVKLKSNQKEVCKEDEARGVA